MQLLRGARGNFNSAPEILAYNCIMYQVIDDHDDEDLEAPRGVSILPFIIGTLLAGLVFFAIWLFMPAQDTSIGKSAESPASRAAYLVALSEHNPAVRRARLMDYQLTYPNSDRRDAIESQLDVINSTELVEWQTLSDSIYSDSLKVEEKWSAMADYELLWNGSLLGGRGDELVTLKQVLDTSKPIDDLPDRRLEASESPISKDIPSDVLAGAPPQIVVPSRPIPTPPPVAPVIELPKDVISMPRVRKNVSPKYPRNAKRKGIGAIVTISMDIDEDGRVDEAELVEIEAERYSKDFVRAARRAAKKTRFHPKTVNGQAVPARDIRKRYIFQVE